MNNQRLNQPINHCTNFRIQVDGYRAVSVCHWVGNHFVRDFIGGDEFTLRGEYTDELINVRGLWQISCVRFKRWYTTGNANLLVN